LVFDAVIGCVGNCGSIVETRKKPGVAWLHFSVKRQGAITFEVFESGKLQIQDIGAVCIIYTCKNSSSFSIRFIPDF
jgi:hypothetical protein